MAWKLDAPGCDCCGCDRLSDDFSSSGTLSNYIQLSGSWSIADGALSTSDANAMIKATTTGAGYQSIRTRFRSEDRNTVDLLGGMAGYSQYMYARVEYDSTGDCGWLSIRNKTTTGDTQLGERLRLAGLDPDEWHTLSLCISPTEDLSEANLFATVDSGQAQPPCLFQSIEQTPSVGIGLQTGGTADLVEFDFLEWHDSLHEDNGCPACECDCLTSEDTFDRTSSELAPAGDDDVGCLWDAVNNFWKVQNGFLIGYSSNATIKHLVPFDERGDEWFATVEARGQPGQKAILHLGWAATPAASVVVEFRAGYKRSRLYLSDDMGVSPAGYVELIDTPPGEAVTIAGCLKSDGDLWGLAKTQTTGTARVSGGLFDVGDPFAGLSVRYHNDGTPSTGDRMPVFFDNFSMGQGGAPCNKCGDVTTGGGCINCLDNKASTRVLVTVPSLSVSPSGLSCPRCADVGGNYLLQLKFFTSIYGVTDDGCCEWRSMIGGQGRCCGPCETDTFLSFFVCHGEASGYRLLILLSWYLPAGIGGGFARDDIYWKAELGDEPPDCTAISQTLDYWGTHSTSHSCSGSGTSATVRSA